MMIHGHQRIAGRPAQGEDRDWVQTLNRFAPKPDVVFYLRVPPGVTAARIPSIPVKALDQCEFGLDLGLSSAFSISLSTRARNTT